MKWPIYAAVAVLAIMGGLWLSHIAVRGRARELENRASQKNTFDACVVRCVNDR